jgi:hypothetical protein
MKKMKYPTYVRIETVIDGSNEEPIDFKCRSFKQALEVQQVLKDAIEFYKIAKKFKWNLKSGK